MGDYSSRGEGGVMIRKSREGMLGFESLARVKPDALQGADCGVSQFDPGRLQSQKSSLATTRSLNW